MCVCVCPAPGGSDLLGVLQEGGLRPARPEPPATHHSLDILQCVPSTLGEKSVELGLVPPVPLGRKSTLGPGLNPAA